MCKIKLLRITTVPISLKHLLKGQMSFMTRNGFKVIMVSSDGPEIPEIMKSEKCDHVIIPLTRKITPFKDLFAIFKLVILISRIKPDIVHTHTPKAGMVGMISAYITRVPVKLHTVSGLPLMEVKGLKRKILNFIESLTYHCADRVYPNSEGLKDFILKSKFARSKKLKVLGYGSSNGIDTSFFDPNIYTQKEKETTRHELGLNSDDYVFIFVGRLVGDKGINELIQAFNDLSLLYESIKLLLVGPYENDLDPLNSETLSIINSNPQIISTGYQNDVRRFFSIASALVFPSYREGFPNVVMQAGSMGIPSIVTNINGCNEIIIDNNNGLIIEAKSHSAIYKAMLFLYQNKVTYYERKDSIRELIINKFERKIFWNILLQEYQSLINNRANLKRKL